MHVISNKLFIALGIILVSLYGFIFYAQHSQIPAEVFVVVDSGDTTIELTNKIADTFGWSKEQKNNFYFTLSNMQWMLLSQDLTQYLSEENNWTREQEKVFLTHSSQMIRDNPTIFSDFVYQGNYNITNQDSAVLLAGMFIKRVEQQYGENIELFIQKHISGEAQKIMSDFVRKQSETLPDLVIFPPQDIVVEDSKLRFSTTYYNGGDGDLELSVKDGKTSGQGDIETDVYQVIKSVAAEEREKMVGTFLWHDEHQHYHFSDFVFFDLLEQTNFGDYESVAGAQVKSTFCIRDVSQAKILNTKSDAEYLVCGKTRQGLSVGWGDTYFYNYADQAIDISGIRSGVYRLAFHVNPSGLIEESDMTNNTSFIDFEYDSKERSVTILNEYPISYPELEHIHFNQVF